MVRSRLEPLECWSWSWRRSLVLVTRGRLFFLSPGTPTSDHIPEKEFPDPPLDLNSGAVPVDDPSNGE